MKLIVLQDVLYIVLIIALSIPLGRYMYRVMSGGRVFLSRILLPVEKCIYRISGTDKNREMTATQYGGAVLAFSAAGLIFLWLLLMLQGHLPFNPEKIPGTSWDLAFNTAASFVTNTNWQAYSGETTLSYLTQSLGLTVQNFMSAAAGIAVLFALFRGFVLKQQQTVGSFWVDLTRVTLYILMPLSLVVALLLVSQGVVQTLDTYRNVLTLETGAVQTIPLGPAASQIAIKQLGTNGGGFFGANSAFPLENPTQFSNLLEAVSILLIPAGLCVSFGCAVNDRRQSRSVYAVMLILFTAAFAAITASELFTAPVYGGVSLSGNMEGKEVIHGIGASSLWAACTTAASNGSVNCMHDSLTPLGGFIPLFLMQLGEIVFGGTGSGLYGMLAFVLMTVFIAGLMVGRTPEYLGKKIEPFDMRMVCLIILVPLLCTLLGTAAAVTRPEVTKWLTNSGAHGFSEVLYAFSSMAANNGSAFAGYAADTVFTNVTGGIIMLLSRFIPMYAVVLLSGNLAAKKTVASGEGTLATHDFRFTGLLLAVVLIIGALSFLPALALGPLADYFSLLK
jgi:potassium-transporting ATPase potassium-binding subunit